MHNTPSPCDLRQRAEAEVRLKGPHMPDVSQHLSQYQMRQLLYELSIYQVELELQNQELLQTTAELEAARASYADLYHRAPVGYCTLDEWGHIVQVNQSCVALLGRPAADLTGQPLRRFIEPDDGVRLASFCAGLLHGKDKQSIEVRMIGPDRRPIWALLEGSALRQENAAPLLRLILADITARRQAQEALGASHSTLTSVLDTALDGFMRIDLLGQILDVNSSYCRQSGYSRSELLGRAVSDLDAQPDPVNAEQRIRQLLEVGHQVFETRHFRKDGSVWDVEISAKFHNQDGGQIYAFHRDISARKSHIAQLATSEERWKFALEGSGDGVWDWNIQTGHAVFSKRYKEMLGFAEDEIGNQASEWSSRVHPDDMAQTMNILQAHIDGKTQAAKVEFRVRCKDGRWRWMLGRGMVVERDAQGQAVRLVGTNSDIHEKKQAQLLEQLRSQVLELLSAGAPWGQVLQALVQGLEGMMPGLLGSILLVDPPRRYFAHSVAPGLPDSSIAVQAGMVACWSQPILTASGRVLGSVAIHARQARQPDAAEIALVDSCAYLASIALEKHQATEKLRQAAAVFSHAREGILILSLEGLIIDANEAATQITGYSRDALLDQNPREVLCARLQGLELYDNMARELSVNGFWSGELWNRRKSGEVFATLQAISVVRDESGVAQNMVVLFSDISAMKNHEKELEKLAHFDVLTALPNRILLSDRMRQAMAQSLRRQQSIALVYLDLDGFKEVNDSLGHGVGDRLLSALANRMKQALREGDTMARMGGDEFVAVLLDMNQASCETMMMRLLQAAAQPVWIDEVCLQSSASLGITFYPQASETDADTLLRQADMAMYQAKLAGKNCYRFFESTQPI
ncbi:MAG: PAS domain S-box protein [Comamonadaceae bacterium]|nr:PAS domain S-box protein [Comamonadaceae bacterium]